MAAPHRPAWSPEVAARITAVRSQASVFETTLAEFESAYDVDAAYAQWLSVHDDEARDSTRGENRVVDGAGHDIEDDRPDAVLAAFRAIVDAARTQ